MHYSPSQFGKYSDCPQQYSYRYMQKLHERTKDSLVFGSAIDEVMNQLHLSLMDSTIKSRPEVMLLQMLDTSRHTHGDELETSEWDSLDELAQRCLDQDIFKAYTDMIDYKVRSVQHNFKLRIHGLSREIIGKSDVIAERAEFGHTEHYESALIVDVKTSKRSMNQVSYRHRFQLAFYALAWMVTQQTKVIPQAELRVLVKNKKLIWQVIRCNLTENALANVIEVARIHDKSGKSQHFPINRDSKWCRKKQCSFFDRCHEEHGDSLGNVLAQCIRG